MPDYDLSRLNFTIDANEAELPIVDWPSQTVIEGTGEVRYLPLSINKELGIERGLWEIAEGIVEDTEVDELNVVLSGHATVEFLDGSSDPIELRPGTFCILKEGARTRWTVHKRLRKAYQIPHGND